VSDRGSIAAFVVVITVLFIACAGLVIDGARIVNARATAVDHAGNAARAGAQEVAVARDGSSVLDPQRASAAANAYLASVGAVGTVSVAGSRVTVTVRVDVRATLLRVVGFDGRHVSATRTATAVMSEDG
jgi:Flp pilus assembly protein TadG